MGAAEFMTLGFGKDADDAFRKAVDHAKHMYGHGGYTGTIAEKDGFYMVPITGKMSKKNVVTKANEEMMNSLRDASDKFGRAGCIEITGSLLKKEKEAAGFKGTRKKAFLFFGWAAC